MYELMLYGWVPTLKNNVEVFIEYIKYASKLYLVILGIWNWNQKKEQLKENIKEKNYLFGIGDRKVNSLSDALVTKVVRIQSSSILPHTEVFQGYF